MATVVLSPIGGAGQQFFDNSGLLLAGGKLYTYAAGTTTPLQTYTDATGTVQNPNPVVLDSSGRPSSNIWLLYQTSYKFVLKTANDVTVFSWDGVINNYVYPAVLPAADGSALTNLNASNIASGTLPWARTPFTPIAATEKGAASGVATLDGTGAIVQAPAAGSVLTTSLAANAVTQVVLSSTGSSNSPGTTYTDTGAAATLTILAGSTLLVRVSVPQIICSGTNNSGAVGVQVNGVDYDLFNGTLGNGASISCFGEKYVTGLAAGTYTIKLRAKSNGTSTVTVANSWFTVTEYKR